MFYLLMDFYLRNRFGLAVVSSRRVADDVFFP